MAKQIDWTRYRLRTCYSMHDCELCGRIIGLGEIYYDGGYGRRAHFECVKLEAKNAENGEQETGGAAPVEG